VVLGKGKPSEIRETSGLLVETVEKKPGLLRSRSYIGDASKVVVQGAGLKQGYLGRPATFKIEAKDAGKYFKTLFFLYLILL